MVQTLNEFNLFLEGVDAEIRLAHRETPRIGLHLLTVFNIKAFGEFQRFDFRQREVDGVIAAIFTRPVREALGDISDAIQIVVM